MFLIGTTASEADVQKPWGPTSFKRKYTPRQFPPPLPGLWLGVFEAQHFRIYGGVRPVLKQLRHGFCRLCSLQEAE